MKALALITALETDPQHTYALLLHAICEEVGGRCSWAALSGPKSFEESSPISFLRPSNRVNGRQGCGAFHWPCVNVPLSTMEHMRVVNDRWSGVGSPQSRYEEASLWLAQTLLASGYESFESTVERIMR